MNFRAPHHEGEHHEARQRHAGHRGQRRQPRPARRGRRFRRLLHGRCRTSRLGPAAQISRARAAPRALPRRQAGHGEARQHQHHEHDEPHAEGGGGQQKPHESRAAHGKGAPQKRLAQVVGGHVAAPQHRQLHGARRQQKTRKSPHSPRAHARQRRRGYEQAVARKISGHAGHHPAAAQEPLGATPPRGQRGERAQYECGEKHRVREGRHERGHVEDAGLEEQMVRRVDGNGGQKRYERERLESEVFGKRQPVPSLACRGFVGHQYSETFRSCHGVTEPSFWPCGADLRFISISPISARALSGKSPKLTIPRGPLAVPSWAPAPH